MKMFLSYNPLFSVYKVGIASVQQNHFLSKVEKNLYIQACRVGGGSEI